MLWRDEQRRFAPWRRRDARQLVEQVRDVVRDLVVRREQAQVRVLLSPISCCSSRCRCVNVPSQGATLTPDDECHLRVVLNPTMPRTT